MDSSSVRTTRLGWLGEFSRYQWTVFLIAWIGWALLGCSGAEGGLGDDVAVHQRVELAIG